MKLHIICSLNRPIGTKNDSLTPGLVITFSKLLEINPATLGTDKYFHDVMRSISISYCETLHLFGVIVVAIDVTYTSLDSKGVLQI